MKLVIVVSTPGAVMSQLLKNEFFRSQIHSIVSDRPCTALDTAKTHNIKTEILLEKDRDVFCDRLLEYLTEHRIDYVVAFYSKLFAGDLLKKYENRIVNLHPSVLPSFKGMDGFGDAVRYRVRYVGSTIHFIDDKMDEGKIILQTVAPLDINKSLAFSRHRIYEQQCRSLLQTVRWLYEDRIKVIDGEVLVDGAQFNELEFSPGLDFEEAINLRIPFPTQDRTLNELSQKIKPLERLREKSAS